MTNDTAQKPIDVEVLYFAGCPNHEPSMRLVQGALDELGIPADVRMTAVESDAEAARLRFLGSPTIRVNGRDIDPAASNRSDFTMACRLYGLSGVPPRALLIEALSNAMRACGASTSHVRSPATDSGSCLR